MFRVASSRNFSSCVERLYHSLPLNAVPGTVWDYNEFHNQAGWTGQGGEVEGQNVRATVIMAWGWGLCA